MKRQRIKRGLLNILDECKNVRGNSQTEVSEAMQKMNIKLGVDI